MPQETLKPLAMRKCPECRKENYVMNVLSGRCTWCGYKAEVKDIGRDVWEIKRGK